MADPLTALLGPPLAGVALGAGLGRRGNGGLWLLLLLVTVVVVVMRVVAFFLLSADAVAIAAVVAGAVAIEEVGPVMGAEEVKAEMGRRWHLAAV